MLEESELAVSAKCLMGGACLPMAWETISGGKILDPTDIP
jgi:hypothetical protein